MRDHIAAHTGSRGNFTLLVVVTWLLARAYLADAQLPPCPTAEDYSHVKVTGASPTNQGKEGAEVELGNDITVTVQQLSTLLHQAECTNPKKKILLFLDERPVQGAIPAPDPNKSLLIFPLKRTEISRDTWTY